MSLTALAPPAAPPALAALAPAPTPSSSKGLPWSDGEHLAFLQGLAALGCVERWRGGRGCGRAWGAEP